MSVLAGLSCVAKRTFFSGPLPPPHAVKEYEEAQKGAAKMIFNQFEKNSHHMRQHDWGKMAVGFVAFGIVVYIIASHSGAYMPFAAALALLGLFAFLNK